MLKNMSMTQVFIAINVIIYIMAVFTFSSFSFNSLELLQFGGATKQSGIIAYFSSNFVHANIFHIIMNMMALKNLGPIVESRLGAKLYAMVYLISCVVIMIIAAQFMPDNVVVVGASAVILALFGMVFTMCVHHTIVKKGRTTAEFKSFFKSIGINMLIVTAISLIPHVSALGHFVGFVVGIIIMTGIIIKHPKQRYFC